MSTYQGSTQVSSYSASGMTFRLDMVVFSGPCDDSMACLFKVDALGGWPSGERIAMYTRKVGMAHKRGRAS